MAHAQKPDFVFPRIGRVHLNRWGRQFSRLLAAEVCASALVFLDRPRSEVAWEYWLATPFATFPFTSPPVRHRVPPGSERALTINKAVHAGGTNRCRNWGFAAVTRLKLQDTPRPPLSWQLIYRGFNELSFTVKRNEGKTHRSNFHCTDVQWNATQERKWRDELPLRASSVCKTRKQSVGDKVLAQKHSLYGRFPSLQQQVLGRMYRMLAFVSNIPTRPDRNSTYALQFIHFPALFPLVKILATFNSRFQ